MAYTTIYYYDYETKVFGGTGLMPEGVSLADYAPDSATLTPPEEPEQGSTFVWDEDAGAWVEFVETDSE